MMMNSLSIVDVGDLIFGIVSFRVEKKRRSNVRRSSRISLRGFSLSDLLVGGEGLAWLFLGGPQACLEVWGLGGGLWEFREVCFVIDGDFVLCCGFGCHGSLCGVFLLLGLLQFNFVYRTLSVISRVDIFVVGLLTFRQHDPSLQLAQKNFLWPEIGAKWDLCTPTADFLQSVKCSKKTAALQWGKLLHRSDYRTKVLHR